jgi:hypothetical protein
VSKSFTFNGVVCILQKAHKIKDIYTNESFDIGNRQVRDHGSAA